MSGVLTNLLAVTACGAVVVVAEPVTIPLLRRAAFIDVGRGRNAHSVTSLWRWAWHSMVTATGSEVMWHGYVRMWMPNAVVSPP